MQTKLVSGQDWITVELPDDATVVEQSMTTPMDGVADLEREVRRALAQPLESPPLEALARPGMKVTIAFDDPTVPCYAPVWATALPIILQALRSGGVALDDIDLLCANALHRQFRHSELAGILGPKIVDTFKDRLRCHDAEDPDGIVALGRTAAGHPVELNRLAVECDLLIYLNTACWRAFNGGWKSICVGLSTFASIRVHHTPDAMSMSTERNQMHAILDEMGELVTTAMAPKPIFKIETVLAGPFQVGRMWSGSVAATRRSVLELVRSQMPPRRSITDERFDILVYGVPEWSPYAAYATMNPLLRLVSTGLGYLGGPIEALGAKGCSVILATPCPDEWDGAHHPSYREVWEKLLGSCRDPYELATHLDSFAEREDYIERYRFHHAFHPTHAVMATFPLKRLRHAARVFVAGAAPDQVIGHLGFQRTDTVEEAVREAQQHHGPNARIGVVRYPYAVNRV